MSRFVNRKSIIFLVIAFTLMAAFAGGVLVRSHSSARAASGTTTKSEFCGKIGKTIQASSGAQMYCFGAQPSGPSKHLRTSGSFGTNVDAANPSEDVANGAQSYGQSEVSIAAAGHYAVEAWNDATGFFATCGAAMNKEELTGLGFSSDSGHTYTDLGGVPNSNCANTKYDGDPSVEALHTGGKTYFYISSLFNADSFAGFTADPRSHLAMAACVASGQGTGAVLTCSQPIIIASSSECDTTGSFCSFLDKEFLSIDPVHGLLYASYTEFGFNPITFASTNIIELAVCDIGNGALGGTPAAPVCTNGATGSALAPAAPYMVIAPTDPAGCENEGAYPAVDRANGDLYVAYEHNWATAVFGCFPGPNGTVQNVLNYIPAFCLTLPAASCSGPTAVNAVNIVSMQGAFIPGYNRFPMNDFPRLATSDAKGTVSMVWNDARYHPAGDILMQSFALVSIGALAGPVTLDSDPGGWHFLPAVRNSNQNGILNVSWYDRSSANTAITSVAAAKVNPLSTATPANVTVTTVASDWNAVSSDIIPNFGDYTDNYTQATDSGNFTGSLNFVAWSDGRIGDPQPFSASRFT